MLSRSAGMATVLSRNTMGLLKSWIKHPDTTDEERYGLMQILVASLPNTSDEQPARAVTAGDSEPCSNELGRVELSKKTLELLQSWIKHPNTTNLERFGLIRMLVIAKDHMQTSNAELPADGPARVGSV